MSAATENAELLELAREFAEGELKPYEAERDAARALPDDLFATLGEMGFFGMAVPESAGGLGLDPVTFHEVLAILAEADPSVAMVVAEHGAAAATLAAEPDADAELVGELAMGGTLITTAALEQGADETSEHLGTAYDAGAVTGVKRYVGNGARSGRFLVVAAGAAGRVLASVDAGDATIGSRTTTMGLSALELVEVRFDDAPGDLLLQPDAVPALGVRRRIAIAAVAVGVARSSLAHALRYAEERSQFGRSLSEFDAIRAKLADMASRTAAAEALVRDAAAGMGAGSGIEGRAAAAKIVASEAAMFAADEAVQIFGGYGYMRHYPVEKRMRDAKGLEVMGGTSEALRRVVANDLIEATRTS
jgi:alkylation response protein AidB-like acyl-CoA dehydrogenase